MKSRTQATFFCFLHSSDADQNLKDFFNCPVPPVRIQYHRVSGNVAKYATEPEALLCHSESLFHIDCEGTASGRRPNIIRRGRSNRRFLVHAKMLASTISQPSASHSHRPSYPQSVSRGGSTPPPVPRLSFLSDTSQSMIPPPRKKKDCSCTKPPSPIKKTPRPGTPTSPLFYLHM